VIICYLLGGCFSIRAGSGWRDRNSFVALCRTFPFLVVKLDPNGLGLVPCPASRMFATFRAEVCFNTELDLRVLGGLCAGDGTRFTKRLPLVLRVPDVTIAEMGRPNYVPVPQLDLIVMFFYSLVDKTVLRCWCVHGFHRSLLVRFLRFRFDGKMKFKGKMGQIPLENTEWRVT